MSRLFPLSSFPQVLFRPYTSHAVHIPSQFPSAPSAQYSAPFVHSAFCDAVGNTSLIKLRGPSELTGCNIYGKAEYENPGGR